MLRTIVRAPILVLSANSALKNSRQIKASQMVRGIAIKLPSQGIPRRSQVSGIKKAFGWFLAAGRAHTGKSNKKELPRRASQFLKDTSLKSEF